MAFFYGRKRHIIITAAVFLINYFLDRITKYRAVQYLKDHEPVRLLYNTIVFRYAENTGAFLSLGADWNMYIKYLVLLIIPIIICIAGLLYLMIKEKSLPRLVIISCIIGGGMGNLIDRLFNEFTVIDFINVGIGSLRSGILNVADLSVTFGVLALLIFDIRKR